MSDLWWLERQKAKSIPMRNSVGEWVAPVLTDGSKISFAHDNAANTLTPAIVAGSLGAADLANRTRSIELTTFALAAGTPDFAVRGSNSRYAAWAFDTTTLEGVTTPTFQVPRDWATGALTVALHWTNLGAGAGNVAWLVNAKEVAAGGDLNSTASEASATDIIAASTQNLHLISVHSISITPSAAGVHMRMNVIRDTSNGSDTLANDVGLLKVQIAYTADM
jgi:hypothetical protein